MLDGSREGRGAVLPEISCVSIAHKPLLQRIKRPSQCGSEEGGRKRGRVRVVEQPSPGGLPYPILPSEISMGHSLASSPGGLTLPLPALSTGHSLVKLTTVIQG